MVKLIPLMRKADERGWFAEAYNQRRFAEFGIDVEFRQDNHVFSSVPGVLRGLHFQVPPRAQAKLVRCLRGRVWDVAVDVRAGSPTYGRWAAAELTAANGLSMYVPVGFAHGYLTLEADTEVEYKVSDFHAPDQERGLAWDDPALAIAWPLPESGPVLSEKDRRLPRLSDLMSPFPYEGPPLAMLET